MLFSKIEAALESNQENKKKVCQKWNTLYKEILTFDNFNFSENNTLYAKQNPPPFLRVYNCTYIFFVKKKSLEK